MSFSKIQIQLLRSLSFALSHGLVLLQLLRLLSTPVEFVEKEHRVRRRIDDVPVRRPDGRGGGSADALQECVLEEGGGRRPGGASGSPTSSTSAMPLACPYSCSGL